MNLIPMQLDLIVLILTFMDISGDMEPASAFSVYAAKRKNSEQLLSKKRRKCQSQKTSSQKRRKHKDVKQTGVNQQVEDKGILNIFAKSKDKGRCH